MKLVSYRDAQDAAGVGIVSDNAIHDVIIDGAPWRSDMRQLIAGDGDPRRLSAGERRYRIDEVRLDAPVPSASKIIAAPVNYRDHQDEMSQVGHISSLGVFLKAPSSLIGTGATVHLPYDDRRFDQEGELALVIGRSARHVSAADAPAHVFGYTCLLDMTMRGGEDRSTRKSFDSFSPMGPWLVTPDEVGALDKLELMCTVNGELRQHARISDLIWGVPALIAYASSVMTLLPGDVITTGTPAGVGQVKNGDELSVTISRIGTLRATVDATDAGPCPTQGAGQGPPPPTELTPVRAVRTSGS